MALTVDDLVAALNMDATPAPGQQLTELTRALTTAVDEITRTAGWLDARTVTIAVQAPRYGRALALPYAHLSAVTAVRDPTGTAVTPTGVNLPAGIVYVPVNALGSWSVDVVGTAWPAALSSAALEWAVHLYETQRLTMQAAEDDGTALPSYAVPNRVAELVTPYALPGFA